MPGTEIETKLRIVRKDISIILLQINWIIKETPIFKYIP